MTTILNPPVGGRTADDEAELLEPGKARPSTQTQAASTPPPTPRPPTSGRTRNEPFPLSIVFIVALLVVLGGLGTWAAMSNIANQKTSNWEFVPTGSGYSTVPPVVPTPLIPASAKTTAAALPPMVETAPVTTITLKIDPPPLGGTYGPKGQVQDNFSPAFFAAPVGKKVQVTVYNYDSAWHTFTAPGLGLNVWFPPGADHPSKTTFSFTAPNAGYYQWHCATPCDPFSMAAAGYMQGDVHATNT